MERSEVLTFQVLLPNSGAVASAAIPGCVQILFTDIGRERGKTLEHKMSWSFDSFMDCDLSVGRTGWRTDGFVRNQNGHDCSWHDGGWGATN